MDGLISTLQQMLAAGLSLVASLLAPLGLAATPAHTAPETAVLTSRPLPSPREVLAARIETLGREFGGTVGIAVMDVSDGWTTDFNGQAVLPQQSVRKLWVAVAVLAAADRGQLTLDDRVLIRREDLSVFHQPLRDRVGPDGYTTTLGALMENAITVSDNAADDALIRAVGGPFAVQVAIVDRNLGDIRFGPNEREIQSRTAGLDWRPEFSFGRAFWEAREALPRADRQAALEAYLADPPDGAAPLDIVDTLGRLQRGELLSPESTARLLGLMARTETGASRLKAGLAPGWTLAHKTGTGQVMGPLATGFNDVGLMTAPDGRVFAVAVMIGATTRPVKERQALMEAVSRTIVESHAPPPSPVACVVVTTTGVCP